MQGVRASKPDHSEGGEVQGLFPSDPMEDTEERIPDHPYPGQVPVRVDRGISEFNEKQELSLEMRVKLLQRRALPMDQRVELPERSR